MRFLILNALAVALPLLVLMPSFGQEKFDPAARAALCAPMINFADQLIIHADLRRLSLDSLASELNELGPVGKLPQVVVAFKALKKLQDQLLAAGADHVIFWPYDTADWPVPGAAAIHVSKPHDPAAVAKLLQRFTPVDFPVHREWVLFMEPLTPEDKPSTDAADYLPTTSIEAARLAGFFRAAGDSDLQIIIPKLCRDAVVPLDRYPLLLPPWLTEEMLPEDREAATDTLIISLNFPPKPAIAWTLIVPNADSADKVRQSVTKRVWPRLLALEVEDAFLENVVRPTVRGNDVRTLFTEKNGGINLGRNILKEAIGDPELKIKRLTSAQNLRYFNLGFHNYQDTFEKHATNIQKDGKPLLSWRVTMLQFMNEGELYSQFKLDEPWDSAHNRTLIPKMPKVYHSLFAPPQFALEGKTLYKAFTGKGTIFGLPEDAKTPDGDDTHTLSLFEGHPDDAVVWTKPEDWEFDTKDPLKGLKGLPQQGLFAIEVSGSVHFISDADLLADTLRELVLLAE